LAWFALSKLGAQEVPVNTAYAGSFLEHQVNISAATSMIVDVALLDVVRDSIERMPRLTRGCFVVAHWPCRRAAIAHREL
jgi:crotonobetaine/carnitine-CoA ligase